MMYFPGCRSKDWRERVAGKKADKDVLAQPLRGIFCRIMFRREVSVPFPQQSVSLSVARSKHENYARGAFADINIASGGR
jgi:hypothetical protein